MPLQWPIYFVLNAKSYLFDRWGPQIGSLLSPARFCSLGKGERGVLGEMDDEKWREGIKTWFLVREIKGENERYKREILREERGLLILADPEKRRKKNQKKRWDYKLENLEFLKQRRKILHS